jgi:dTMP kinase
MFPVNRRVTCNHTGVAEPLLRRRKGFGRLLAGQGVSALGDWMATTAFMALTLKLTGSPTAVGGILTVRLLPAIVAGPIAARAAHRAGPRPTMLTMDALRVAMVAVVPFVQALWWVYLWAFMIEVASLVFLPARDACVPDLVDEDDLPAANGMLLGSSYGTIPIGAGAFALVAALPVDRWPVLGDRPYALAFWVDAATYVVSFLLIAGIAELSRATPETATDEPPGLRGAFRLPLVRAVLPATLGAALGLGCLFSVGIVFVREVLDASDAAFGLLIVSFGVGAGLGLLLLQRRGGEPSLAWVREGIGVAALSMGAIAIAPAIVGAYLAAITLGAGISHGIVAGMSVLQRDTDGEDRLLAFTAFHISIRLALGISALAAGAAGDLVPEMHWPGIGEVAPARTVILGAGAVVLLSLAAVPRTSPTTHPPHTPHAT